MNIQIEWLTAGECIAGMHEVVVSEKTTDAIKVAQEQKRSLWRVSSTVSDLNAFNPVFFTSVTSCNWGKPCLYLNSKNVTVTLFRFFPSHVQLFAHIASDAVLKPLGHFANSPLAGKYPPICTGEFVEKELAVINLKGK